MSCDGIVTFALLCWAVLCHVKRTAIVIRTLLCLHSKRWIEAAEQQLASDEAKYSRRRCDWRRRCVAFSILIKYFAVRLSTEGVDPYKCVYVRMSLLLIINMPSAKSIWKFGIVANVMFLPIPFISFLFHLHRNDFIGPPEAQIHLRK